MAKENYRSISIDTETDQLLEMLASDIQRSAGVKPSPHAIIKLLAQKEASAKGLATDGQAA